MIWDVETGEPSRPSKRTRGPNSGKALTAEFEKRGRLRLVKPDGGLDSDAAGKYSTRVGGLIKEKSLCCGQSGPMCRKKSRTKSTTGCR